MSKCMCQWQGPNGPLQKGLQRCEKLPSGWLQQQAATMQARMTCTIRLRPSLLAQRITRLQKLSFRPQHAHSTSLLVSTEGSTNNSSTETSALASIRAALGICQLLCLQGHLSPILQPARVPCQTQSISFCSSGVLLSAGLRNLGDFGALWLLPLSPPALPLAMAAGLGLPPWENLHLPP